MQPGRQRACLVAEPPQAAKIRSSAVLIASGSVTTAVSSITLPVASTTQIAVSAMPTSRPQKNSIARLPRCRSGAVCGLFSAQAT
jgi:hypothetical protein